MLLAEFAQELFTAQLYSPDVWVKDSRKAPRNLVSPPKPPFAEWPGVSRVSRAKPPFAKNGFRTVFSTLAETLSHRNRFVSDTALLACTFAYFAAPSVISVRDLEGTLPSITHGADHKIGSRDNPFSTFYSAICYSGIFLGELAGVDERNGR